jgi:hypothetical protein
MDAKKLQAKKRRGRFKSSNFKGEEKASDLDSGGYMAIYHDIEEISYGPLCGLPAISRVFYCIRHKLLRDGLGQKAIGASFVMEKTGLTKAQVVNSAKKLEKNGLIVIKTDFKETPSGKIQYYENKYELNPAIFGTDYNWYKNNPTVRVYSGNKVGSYSRKGVSPSGINSNTTPGIKSDTRGVSDHIPGKELKLAELFGKIAQNNPSSNNPYTNNPSSEDLLNSGDRKRERRQQCSDPQQEKERQFREAKKAGII